MNAEKTRIANQETDNEAYEAPVVEALGRWETVTGSV